MAAVPFAIRHHRTLALVILSVGTALAGALLGAMVLGLMAATGEHLTFNFEGLGPTPTPFEPEAALLGAITTGLLSALVPYLAWRARGERDDIGTIVRTAAKLGVANTAFALLVAFGTMAFHELGSGFGRVLDIVVISAIATLLGTLVGAIVAGPLGIVFGLVFALPIEHTWVAFTNDDARAPDVAARWTAAMLVFVGAFLQLTPHATFAHVGGAVLAGAATACIGLSLALRAASRRFIARLPAHPDLACVPVTLAEIPKGVIRLATVCDRAVVQRTHEGPYRERPRALALAP